MPPLMQLPTYQIQNALLNFEPVSQGLDTYRQGQEAARRADVARTAGNALMGGNYKEAMATALRGDRADLAGVAMQAQSNASQMESAALDRSAKLGQLMAGPAQMIIEQHKTNPQMAAQSWRMLRGSHPQFDANLQKFGIDPNDYVRAAQFIVAQAAGYRDPLQQEAQRAQIAASRASTAHTTAAEARAAGLYPMQMDTAKLDYEAKKREFDNPSVAPLKVGKDEDLYAFNKKTGGYNPIIQRTSPEGLGPYKDMKQKADVEEGLRKEIASAAKDYIVIRDSAAKLEEIAKNPSAASDIALIFSYMKALDPGSVVRETEFATAQNAAGVPDRLRNTFNRVLNGERLNPTQRQDFLNQARTIASKQFEAHTRTLNHFRDVSKRLGVDERNVIQAEPAPIGRNGARPASPTDQTPRVASDADYDALPSGTRFIDPNGKTRIKP